jgi:hypothetical protein
MEFTVESLNNLATDYNEEGNRIWEIQANLSWQDGVSYRELVYAMYNVRDLLRTTARKLENVEE